MTFTTYSQKLAWAPLCLGMLITQERGNNKTYLKLGQFLANIFKHLSQNATL